MMRPTMREKAKVMDADAIRRALVRMAHEVLERNGRADILAVVGVPTRGVQLAQRLASIIDRIESTSLPVGTLSIANYRDDIGRSPATHTASAHTAKATLPFDVAQRSIILVDDVLYTGRTVRAALDALIDLGRPQSIQLAVLIDRGHRELPVRPDYVGKNLPTSSREHVAVRLQEIDGVDEVVIEEPADGNAVTR
ncbi:MAG: bifunctional pyr operon transcriptional regulator/uracil phosphoribosyltransferase PyrR [bacterium]